MPSYDELEREVIDHFKREYIASAEEHADQEIYKLMGEHMYGKGSRDPMLPVDWDRVFRENQCPECADTISLREDSYLCGKCNLKIPLKLYDKAAQEYNNRQSIREDYKRITDKTTTAGYTKHRLGILYQAAVEEALNELDAKKRQATSETRAKSAGQGRRGGITIKRGGDTR
jgi:hypothetical protein